MHLHKIKTKLFIALILFLICAIVLVAAAYAWLVLSRAPEVMGINTNIGANGSLEIVLLSDETHDDPDSISSGVGSSMEAQAATLANLVWGNLIDLADASYGLAQSSLRPSRLNISGDRVADNILLAPDYGIDGRVTGFYDNVISGKFTGDAFEFMPERQGYGVRGIGTYSGYSVNKSSLATARSTVKYNTSVARSNAASAWRDNGASLMNILMSRYLANQNEFGAEDVATVKAFLAASGTSLEKIDLAMRYGMVGMAASEISDEAMLSQLKSVLLNTSVPLSVTLAASPVSLSSDFNAYIALIEADIATVNDAIEKCDLLADGCTWDQLSPLVKTIADPDNIYLGDSKMSSASGSSLSEDNILTLAPGSGILADIADFAGDYSAFSVYSGFSIELRTMSGAEPAYLVCVSNKLDSVEAAGDSGTVNGNVALEDIYGFMIDLAFRCNAEGGDLLLQTEETQRIDPESESSATQGQGSYLQFESESLGDDAVIALMDAVRVVFVDDKNTVLAVAKPNTSNYETADGGIVSPLYLYEYTLSAEGSLLMGARLRDDAAITTLEKNKARLVSVIVILDGDCVTNGMAAAVDKSVTGTLNLEFYTNVDLVPAKQQIVTGN